MNSFNKVRLAGIVSVLSICGVLATEIVGNVIGDYVTDQLKDWQGLEPVPAAETADSTPDNVVLPILPAAALPETVIQPPVGEPAAAVPEVGGPTPESGVETTPSQQAAPSQPPGDLAFPRPDNRAVNRAALKKRIYQWRSQRMLRQSNRWHPPGYPSR
jgi:hypothetical protein